MCPRADVPEIGRQRGDALVDVHARPLPVDQGLHSEAMAEVVDPRAHLLGAQADPSGYLPERCAQANREDGGACNGEKEARVHGLGHSRSRADA